MKTLNLILLFVNFFIYTTIFQFLFSPDFVLFPDIGQGTSVIIKEGKNVFIYDTGKENYKLLNSLRNNLPFYQKRIDIVIISHPDIDHYLNLLTLFSKYKIRVLIINKFALKDENFKNWIIKFKEKNQSIIFLDDKDVIKTKNNDLEMKILHPDKDYSKDNDNSLVVLLKFKNKSFLLTGDIEKEGILSLQKRYDLKNIDFLLYPHHGSKYSLIESFYKKLNPKVIIIQNGFNRFGHPHKEVIDFFKQSQKEIWLTNVLGDLKIEL